MASSRFPPFPTISSSSSAESLHPSHKLRFPFHFKTLPHLLVARSADSGAGMSTSNAAGEKKLEGKAEAKSFLSVGEKKLGTKEKVAAPTFEHPGWIQGRWDLKKFQKGGKTDWDAVIDAEARRRKCLEDNPEASRNDESIPFSTSIIPWWAWAKRYYLPEPKLLNGHAAIFGFFMAYFVDSLTGIGLVDQKENFVCKSLLFFLVAGVLLVRKNEGIGKVKNFIEETISYDKQWKATWQDDSLRNDSS